MYTLCEADLLVIYDKKVDHILTACHLEKMCDLRKLETDLYVIKDNNSPDRRFRLVLT